MEIASVLNHYLDPALHAPQQELKPLKMPACDQDVQRFEAILNGEGTFQPKTIDLVMPATEPNAIENMSHRLVDKISTMKRSIDSRFGRVNEVLGNFNSKDFKVADALRIQWEVCMYSLECSMVSKSGDKAAEGIKTLFRNQ